LGAAPLNSGYSDIPQKRDVYRSTDEFHPILDKSVRPEEVYKNGVQEISLIATDTGYLPSRLIVRANIPVRLYITSASARTFCFVLDEFSLRKGVENQRVVEVNFLPTKPGHYRFYCPVKEIQGELVVRD
jgi:plastocyanin domain-containing protein